MNLTSITPDQIKSIASEIRKTEEHHLGAKLPHSSALNAVVRALGLGQDFRAFKASFAAAKAPKVPEVTLSSLIFAIENEAMGDLPCSDEITAGILAIIEDAGFSGEVTPEMHGFSLILAGSNGSKHTMRDILALKVRLQEHLESLIEAEEIGKILGSTQWQKMSDDRQLTVNFRYCDNDQVVSASVSESAWKVRGGLSESDEFCVLVLGGDIDIPLGYNKDDITVEDVMTEVVFWYD